MWTLSPPLTSISKKGSSGFCYKRVWSLSHRTQQQGECDAGRGQESLSGAGAKRMQEQVASCLSCSEIGGTELYASVAPKEFGWTEGNNLVWPSSSQWRHLSPQLSRQVRSRKDLQGICWKICKELDAGNAKKKKSRRSFFLKGETNMHETDARAQRNTRELHLELVGDKVTYVRAYWLRSQVKTLDHRSYSSFKLKMGLPFFI